MWRLTARPGSAFGESPRRPQQRKNAVEDDGHCWNAQPVFMKRVFDVAIKQPGDGVAKAAAGAPRKAEQL